METKGALVSIIVPVYGTEAYLSACIDSLCRQTYQNIQIILVDDESPDRCPQICDAYVAKDERIKVVHQKNKGVSGARNTGLDLADGDYVMFLDSDDELYPNAVELLLQKSVTYGADIVSGTMKTVVENGNSVADEGDGACTVFQGDEPLLLSLKGDHNTESACAKLYKTSFIKGICFEEGRNINEDGFFVFQCYVKKPILVQWNTVIYRCNIRQGSGSRQMFSDKYLSMLYFLERKKEYLTVYYPQYESQTNNMDVRTNLYFLDVLCRSTERKYRKLQSSCVRTVRKLYAYHQPIHSHHRQLAWIVAHGFYPIYKMLIRLKYYR